MVGRPPPRLDNGLATVTHPAAADLSSGVVVLHAVVDRREPPAAKEAPACTVPQLVLDARRGAGLTQVELARAAETSQSALARYESGATEPSVATLERVLHACGRRLQLTSVPSSPVRGGALSVRAQLGPGARRLRRLRAPLLPAAASHGIRGVRVFGSVARAEASDESDIDLLVYLAPGRTLLDLAAFKREASQTLGMSVDVATEDMLKPRIRDTVLAEAISL